MAVEDVGVRLVAEDAARFEKATRDARKALLEFVMATQDGSRDIEKASDRSGQAVVAFVEESGRAYGRLDAFAEIAIGALRRVGEIAVNAMLEAGRATAQFMQDSVSAAGNFESTLNRFSAVTGDSLASAGMDVEDFSDLFLQMGADTQYSAQEAGEAAVNLAKGGIAPLDIAAGALAATLALAAAGELDLATSAEILAKQLGVWAAKGVTAIDITNLLAQAANASTVDVDELANGLANVQGRAAGMGVEYDELVQTMALIAPAFESASTAGTSLNNFLARLIPATEKAEGAMIDLGLATSDGSSLFFDAQGSFIGMEQAIGLLQAATVGLSEEERAAAFNIIFGNDAMGAAIKLSEEGASGYNEMGIAMDGAGDAASQAEKRQQGYNFAQEQMAGSIETLQIVIGTELLPVLTDLIQNHITPGINSFLEFSRAIFESEDPIAALIKKIDEIVPGFSEMLAAIANIPTRIAEISNAFQEDFAPEIQLAKNIFETAMIVIGDITTAVMDTITSAIDTFTSDLNTDSTTWTALMRAFEGVWIALEPIIMGVLATLGALFLVFLGVATGMFTGILNAIDPFLQGFTMVLNFITIVLEGVQEVVMGFVDLVVSLFQGNTDGVLAALTRMHEGVVAIIFGLIGAVLAGIGGLVMTGLGFIEGFVLGIVEFFARLYKELVGGSIIPDLVSDILTWIGKLPEQAVRLVGDMVTGIKDLFNNTDWAALGKGIIDGIVEGIISLAGNLATAATNAATAAYTAVTDFLGMESPSRLFMEVGEMTMQGFAIGIDESASLPALSLESAAATLALEMPSMMSNPISGLASAPVNNNTYNTTNVFEGSQFGVNVRTQESSGTVGNTIKALQSINRIQRG